MNPVILDPSLMQKNILENTELSKKVAVLENTIDDLKHRLDVSETECENAHATINQLKNKLIIKQENIKSEENKFEKSLLNQLDEKNMEINNLVDERKQLQYEHDEQIKCLETRLHRTENVVKRLNKIITENKINAEKKTKQLNKSLKTQIKSWKKELGLERSKKIKAEKKIDLLENHLKTLESVGKETISCQTNHTPDVPYSVSEILPPIFGSQLCKTSRTVHHLAKSLPDLSTLSWVKFTAEDIIADEAEQALNEQYDREINDFYKEAKTTVENLNQVFEENCIGKLFETER